LRQTRKYFDGAQNKRRDEKIHEAVLRSWKVHLFSIIQHADRYAKAFLFVAGKGNNGANAIAAARMLHLRGRSVQVAALVNNPETSDGDNSLRPNIQEQIDLFLDFVGRDRISFVPEALDEIHSFSSDGHGVIIDGILGTGINSPPRGISADAIRAINNSNNNKSSSSSVLSIDIPSGLNHITGEAPGDCVKATWTLNLHMLKIGQLEDIARPYVGMLWSAESGLGFSTFPGLEERFVSFYSKGPIREVDPEQILFWKRENAFAKNKT